MSRRKKRSFRDGFRRLFTKFYSSNRKVRLDDSSSSNNIVRLDKSFSSNKPGFINRVLGAKELKGGFKI